MKTFVVCFICSVVLGGFDLLGLTVAPEISQNMGDLLWSAIVVLHLVLPIFVILLYEEVMEN